MDRRDMLKAAGGGRIVDSADRSRGFSVECRSCQPAKTLTQKMQVGIRLVSVQTPDGSLHELARVLFDPICSF